MGLRCDFDRVWQRLESGTPHAGNDGYRIWGYYRSAPSVWGVAAKFGQYIP